MVDQSHVVPRNQNYYTAPLRPFELSFLLPSSPSSTFNARRSILVLYTLSPLFVLHQCLSPTPFLFLFAFPSHTSLRAPPFLYHPPTGGVNPSADFAFKFGKFAGVGKWAVGMVSNTSCYQRHRYTASKSSEEGLQYVQSSGKVIRQVHISIRRVDTFCAFTPLWDSINECFRNTKSVTWSFFQYTFFLYTWTHNEQVIKMLLNLFDMGLFKYYLMCFPFV